MKKLLAIAALGIGCGDGAPASHDAGDDGPGASFAPGCEQSMQSGDEPYRTAASLGPVAPGTLAGWNPDGRWFLTGTPVGGVSSFHFERTGDEVIVDRDPSVPGEIDDDLIFQRTVVMRGDMRFVIAKRVSDRAADGSVRAVRAVCDGKMCTVCTARMIRAERNPGEGEGKAISLVGQLFDPAWGPGYTFNVRVAGTLAYLIRQDGLHIIETIDPAHPVELGLYRRNGEGYSNDVKLVDAAGGKRYALIADYPVDVVDVTNPAAPALAAQIPEEAHTLATERRDGRTYAYFGNYDASTPIYDVTDPAAPVRLGRYMTKGRVVHDLSVADGIAYLNAWDAGFLAVDFSAPDAPVLLGTWAPTPTRSSHSNWTATIGGRRFALHGEESYGAHLDLVDIDPDRPQTFMKPFASYKTRDHVSIHNLMVFGTKAYFTYYQDGVRVLDLASPATPALVGYYNTWDPQAAYTSSAFFEGAVGLDVDTARRLIFVADSPRGLLILRDETP